jgi:hypothetical protein
VICFVPRVGVAGGGEVLGGVDAVVDVQDTPLPDQRRAVGAAVAGAVAAAGDVLQGWVEPQGGVRGGAGVDADDQRRRRPGRGSDVRVGRRVEQAVDAARSRVGMVIGSGVDR